MADAERVEYYSFTPDDLRVDARTPGISAFMRIKNGADFLEPTIRSHIAHFDEIVAVYNQCTDATPAILSRLAQEYGRKLRVFHYVPRVFPPGSEEHAKEPADSPHSLVNYYNFTLAQTRWRWATKLDDDHLAMGPALGELTGRIRTGAFGTDTMVCFGGINLTRGVDGNYGVLSGDRLSGSGDIGFFPVSPYTFFKRDVRFERFHRGRLKRRFAGLVYWHLKYLKPDFGFANYELQQNPGSRYRRKLSELQKHRTVVGLSEARGHARPTLWPRSLLPEKARLLRDRQHALHASRLTDADLREALRTIGISAESSPPA